MNKFLLSLTLLAPSLFGAANNAAIFSAFSSAIDKEDAITVAHLAKKHDPNITDNDGCTPLHWAAAKGNAEVVIALLDNGAKLEVPSRQFGSTALFCAVGNKHPGIMKVLIERGANRNAHDIYGQSLLYCATLKEMDTNDEIWPMFDFLLENGVQPTYEDTLGLKRWIDTYTNCATDCPGLKKRSAILENMRHSTDSHQ